MASCAASTSLRQDREQRGIETCGPRELRENQSETARAGRGLEQDSVAGGEGVERMNSRKKKRIISRPDHKHDAERLALHFKRNALHPERTSAFSTATRCEHAGRVPLQPAARIGQRKNFGDELLGDGSIADRGGRDGERLCVRRDQVAKFADESQPMRDRLQRPSRLSVARFRASVIRAFCVKIDDGMHHAGSRFMGANCGAGVGSGEAEPEISEEQARADARGFENHRQAAARMRAAADEINAIDVLEAVVRAEMQHLVEAVREIERRAVMNLVLLSQSAGVIMRSKRMRRSTSVKPAFAICRSIFARKRSRSRDQSTFGC